MTTLSSGEAAPLGSADLDLRLRRAIVRAERTDALVQDQIDCAELVLAAGLRDQAAALYAVIFLELGFSDARIKRQRELSARTGWWAGATLPPVAMPAPGLSVDLAIAELRSLLAYGPSLAGERQPPESWLPADTFGRAPPSPTQDDRATELATRLLPLLTALPAAAGDALAARLHELIHALRGAPPFRVADHIDREPGHLAAILALGRARAFLARNQDLLEGLHAPPAFVERAAQLHAHTLGPYFSNVAMLLRDVRDIFAIIEAARGAIPSVPEQECWTVLLSSHLSRDRTLDLVDELGDRGLEGALRALLVRTARLNRAQADTDIVWRIRDAAIDIGSRDLAEEAQHLIARWRPNDANEWKILGEIRAWQGDLEGAALAYDRGLTLAPSDGSIVALQASMAAGNPLYLERGFGTSEGRWRLRQARLKAYRDAA